MDFVKLTSNLNSEDFKKYLKYYETFHIDRKKCLKNKKCSDSYEETPNHLKSVKGGKEKIILKPKYIFIDLKKKELIEKIQHLENEIRNFRFLVETNTTKKLAESFSKVKDEYLSKKNELNEINNYLNEISGGDGAKEKLIEINSNIMELEISKRKIYFDIVKESNTGEKRKKILEYLDNSEIERLKKEKNKIINIKKINYMVKELPEFTQKYTDNKPEDKKKKIIKKRCPPGQRRSKKTGECEPKEK